MSDLGSGELRESYITSMCVYKQSVPNNERVWHLGVQDSPHSVYYIREMRPGKLLIITD